MATISPGPTMPWWRVRLVWLAIAGPLTVVLASFATLGLALSYPDPVLASHDGASRTAQPALAARNHAASPPRTPPAAQAR